MFRPGSATGIAVVRAAIGGRKARRARRLVPAFLLAASAFIAAATGAGESGASGGTQKSPDRSLEALVRQYVALRTETERLEASWREQKAVLESELTLLNRRVAEAGKTLEEQRQRNAALESETRAAEARQETCRKAVRVLESHVASMEQWLKDFLRSLPAPLQARIRSAAGRGGASVIESDAGERLATLLKMLEAIASVDQEVLHARMMLPGPDGAAEEVQVLFFGLGAGYALSADGRRGAVARVTPEGWTWQWRDGLAGPVREAIERCNRERPPGFVRLPVHPPSNADQSSAVDQHGERKPSE